MTVSLDRFAKVDPSVLQVGANTNRLIGLMLTQNAEFPVQTVKAYASLMRLALYLALHRRNINLRQFTLADLMDAHSIRKLFTLLAAA